MRRPRPLAVLNVLRFIFSYLPENTNNLPTCPHWSNPFTLTLRLTLWNEMPEIIKDPRTLESKVHFNLHSANRKKSCLKNKTKKKAGGNLSTFWQKKKKKVGRIYLLMHFFFLYFAILPWPTGRPTSQGWESPAWWVCGWLGRAWGCHGTPNAKSGCCRQPQRTANPTRNIPFPVLHLPLPCSHSRENSACPEKGEGAQNVFA